MDFIDIQLNSDHKQCIISLINKITAKSPHLSKLESDSLLFTRLVSVITLIESTLCSKYQIALKRNSTESQSIHLIKSWLKQYYSQELIASLCQIVSQNSCQTVNENEIKDNESVTENNDKSNATTDDNSVEYKRENIDRDVGVIALLILFIAHKLRQSLPRINAYFSPEWQTLSQFDSILNRVLNFDKLLDLIQNELCIKRKQLEITKSKVLSLKSTLNSRTLEQISLKKTKLDYRSNLFAEYEDNDTEETNDLVGSDVNEEDLSEDSEGSAIFVDNVSDDDYEPKNKSLKVMHKKIAKKSPKIGLKSGRGRGRPPKSLTNNKRISGERSPITKSRGRPPRIESPVEEEEEGVDTPFECDVCGKRFAKEYRLTRHSFTHLGHKQFVCDFVDCNESFDLKWKLSEHKSEHNGAEEDESYTSVGHNSFECEWADCSQVFASKRELTVHEHEMHANRSQSKYSCDWPQCREIFENKIDWRKHVKTHGKITPTECGFPGCPKSFYKLDSLENHRKIHETFNLDELS